MTGTEDTDDLAAFVRSSFCGESPRNIRDILRGLGRGERAWSCSVQPISVATWEAGIRRTTPKIAESSDETVRERGGNAVREEERQ